MRLLVVSDAHGKGMRINKVIENIGEIDYILYGGDNIRDLANLKVKAETKLIAVKGNCDYGVDCPEEEIIDLENHRIFLTHGHKYRVKLGLDRLYYKAKEVGADIVVFGHTHCRLAIEEDGVLFFNPGSVFLPRDGKPPCYGIIDILDNKLEYQHLNFG